jgi:hypothetical protein
MNGLVAQQDVMDKGLVTVGIESKFETILFFADHAGLDKDGFGEPLIFFFLFRSATDDQIQSTESNILRHIWIDERNVLEVGIVAIERDIVVSASLVSKFKLVVSVFPFSDSIVKDTIGQNISAEQGAEVDRFAIASIV